MTLDPLDDRTVIDYWDRIASKWTTAVRNDEIESRKIVTNKAIVDAVVSRSPESVLDIGCGEGWLARALADEAIHVSGVDAVASFIANAEQLGGGDFSVLTHEEIADGKLTTSFDVAVCNFSLLGAESVEGLFRTMPQLLTENGAFVVQTLHPLLACGDQRYEDGWRRSPWTGFSSEFSEPSPWYFRTFESWIKLFSDHLLRIVEIREPPHPASGKPASVIFIATAT